MGFSNVTGHQSTNCDQTLGRSMYSTASKVFAYSIVWLIALIGNTCVIGVVIRSPRLRKPINYLIASMAASDLAAPLFSIPIRVVEELHGSEEWMIDGATGNALCKLCYFFTDLSPMVSVLTLVIVTVDRFRAVARPFRASTRAMSNRMCFIAIAATWIFSMGVFAPYFYTFRLMERDNITVCAGSWEPALDHVSAHTLYVTLICVLLIIVPYIALIALYSRMLCHLRTTSALGASMKSRQKLHTDRKRNKRIVCMALAIVIIYGLCWMPFTCYLLFSFHQTWRPPQCFTTVFFVVQFLSLTNSAANPSVYFVFIRSYWRELKCLLMNYQKPLGGADSASRSSPAKGPRTSKLDSPPNHRDKKIHEQARCCEVQYLTSFS